MIIIMEECEAFYGKECLLNDLAKYPKIDMFVQALVEGKAEVSCLEAGVTVDGQSYRLWDGGTQNKVECEACIKALKQLPQERKQVAQDGGYIQWDMFERELFINLDVSPSVSLH